MRLADDGEHTSMNSLLGNDTYDVPPPKTILSLLLGFCIGFFLGAGAVVLIRGLSNETDGMTALTQALMIFGPAMILTGLIWFAQRADSKRVMNKLAIFVALFGGLGFGAAIWFTAPTEIGMQEALLERNMPLILERVDQLAKIREQIEAIPFDALDGNDSDKQLAELRQTPFNFLRDDYDLPDEWNTLLASDTDFARIKAGTDPKTVMDRTEMPHSKFFFDDRYEYSVDSEVDTIAQVAYGHDYMWLYETRQFVKKIQQLRYVCVIRMVYKTEPQLLKDQFVPGYQQGQVFCFDLETDKLIGAFTFSNTNTRSVDYKFDESGTNDDKENSAEFYLEKDLHENSWPAFWVKLHTVAEKATSNYMEETLPYENDWLTSATELAEAKKAANAKTPAGAEQTEPQLIVEEPTQTTPPAGADEISLTSEEMEEIKALMADAKKLQAVIRVRAITGASLKDCKTFVENLPK